jgi:predicted methyltransferase
MMVRTSTVWKCLMIASALIAPIGAQAPADKHAVHQLHGDPAAYIAELEDPKRDGYQKPREVLEALAIKQGEVVADIGAGSGYFAIRLAHHVGASGRVYAVDISPDMIRHLHARVRDLGLLNVLPILSQADDPLLPQAVDRFLIVNVWHHIENRTAYLALMKKRLKPGGQVVMIDFHKRELPIGPPVGMKIDRQDLLNEMKANGFRLVTEHTFLPYQYFLGFSVAN